MAQTVFTLKEYHPAQEIHGRKSFDYQFESALFHGFNLLIGASTREAFLSSVVKLAGRAAGVRKICPVFIPCLLVFPPGCVGKKVRGTADSARYFVRYVRFNSLPIRIKNDLYAFTHHVSTNQGPYLLENIDIGRGYAGSSDGDVLEILEDSGRRPLTWFEGLMLYLYFGKAIKERGMRFLGSHQRINPQDSVQYATIENQRGVLLVDFYESTEYWSNTRIQEFAAPSCAIRRSSRRVGRGRG